MSRRNWPDEKIFDRLLSNKSNKTHWDNVRELRSRGSEAIFNRCVVLLYSETAKERLIGAEILSQLGLRPRPFIKKILKLFFDTLKKETDNSVISTILYGIGHNNEHLKKSEISHLCSFKNHKSLEVKEGLVFALGGINNDIAIDTLIKFTETKNNSIRDWATFGLGCQTIKDSPKIREALWNRINDKHLASRQQAIYGLAVRKDERIKDIIKRELETMDNHCSLLLESIEELNDKQFIGILEEKLSLSDIEEKVNPQWLKNTIEKLKE